MLIYLQESPTPVVASPVGGSPTATHPPPPITKQETPASILKPGVTSPPQAPPPEPAAPPPPPERGSSYTVMSMRNKETTKRVSFDTAPVSVANTPTTLQLDETVREDPNVRLWFR